MPVDYFSILLPLLVFASIVISALFKRVRKFALVCICFFSLITFALYFLPGVLLSLKAEAGDAESQYKLGLYYWSRFGYLLSNIEERDRWWIVAAENGHIEAMSMIGGCYMKGTSSHIRKDLARARFWLTKASTQGDKESKEAIALLDAMERK